ncbi:hypothetical protein KAW18_02600 [candidate division WOR-3 bacterium]|nr:hypothetical protein [candidate division WOR-3 bacterium]
MKYDESIDSILEEPKICFMSNEIKHTTIVLPQLMRIAIADLHQRHFKLSFMEVGRRIIEHGLFILQHKHYEAIEAIKDIKIKLRYPKVKRLRNYMTDSKTKIDGMEKPAKRSIGVRYELYAAIEGISSTLNIELSSFIRLCIYYSLSTSDELPSEVTLVAIKEIESFEYDIRENKVVLRGFEYSEKLWEDEELWKNGKELQT